MCCLLYMARNNFYVSGAGGGVVMMLPILMLHRGPGGDRGVLIDLWGYLRATARWPERRAWRTAHPQHQPTPTYLRSTRRTPSRAARGARAPNGVGKEKCWPGPLTSVDFGSCFLGGALRKHPAARRRHERAAADAVARGRRSRASSSCRTGWRSRSPPSGRRPMRRPCSAPPPRSAQLRRSKAWRRVSGDCVLTHVSSGPDGLGRRGMP